MKSFYRLMLAAPVLVFTLNAQAGGKYANLDFYIYGDGGSGGSEYVQASRNCYELPDGMGGKSVYGFGFVGGYINGNRVLESESYEDLSSCPDFGKVGGAATQTVVMAFGGVSLTAECTNQYYSKGSGNGQNKVPGQKPQNFTFNYRENRTDNQYDGTCVITALDTAGPPEVFGNSAFVNLYESFQN